jgi:hypothetical protein
LIDTLIHLSHQTNLIAQIQVKLAVLTQEYKR